MSYGHDEHAADALRIKADLQARGHEVWFDLDRLSAGRDWESYIEQGLRSCDKMVLLMTPYSVGRRDPRDPRSRDGYCLNEIAKALEQNKLIIPVLLVSLAPDGPPTSICRIQYLDLCDAVPIAKREAVYQVRFDRLSRAIEQDELDFAGGQARLVRLLRPLRFEAEMGRHIAQFRGRRWLLEEIDGWLRGRPDSRVLWLTGGPGIGKTAIAAHLCHTRREVLAYHLCIAGHDDKGDAKRALLSIAYQLSQHMPEYERRLHQLDLAAESDKNAQTLFDNLMVQPLGAGFRAPDGPRLVVIDAIDEATRNGRNELAELIGGFWDNTPPWLRLIITSRPTEPGVAAVLTRLRPYLIDAKRPENMADLRQFLEAELARRSIPADERVVQGILERCGGFFLYAKMVLEALDQQRLSIDRIEEFPVGLGGYYEWFFQRQFPVREEYDAKIRPLLEIVCAQRDVLPLPVLGLALGDPPDLLGRLAELGSLFPRTPPEAPPDQQTVAPFHKSLTDWVTTSGGPYAIELAVGEALLAKAALDWKKVAALKARRYLLLFGVVHLVNARRFVEACELMGALLERPPRDLTAMHLHEAGLRLCAGLAKCPPEQAERLPAQTVVQIAVRCGGIDHHTMQVPFLLLYEHHRDEWPQLRRIILGSRAWSAMYAASLVLAEAHSQGDAGRALAEIAELTASDDPREQELGLYALKLFEGNDGAVLDIVRRLAASDAFLIRALLNEILLLRALEGGDACELIEKAGLWAVRWPYLRTQLDDIAAIQELLRRSPTPFSAEPGVARAREELRATLRGCDELLGSPAIAGEPVLRDLLEDFERLPRKLANLSRAAGPIRRSASLGRLLSLLFAHPAWEVRAGASALAATVATSRPEVVELVDSWIDHPDYRVRYAAIEAAYGMRHWNAAPFERAVLDRAADEQAWVRGIVADCVSEWVVREGAGATQRMERFKPQVVRLLHDDDMWPLETMVAMIQYLRGEGVDAVTALGGPVGGLLANVPEWHTMERVDLQRALDVLRRQSDAREGREGLMPSG